MIFSFVRLIFYSLIFKKHRKKYKKHKNCFIHDIVISWKNGYKSNGETMRSNDNLFIHIPMNAKKKEKIKLEKSTIIYNRNVAN